MRNQVIIKRDGRTCNVNLLANGQGSGSGPLAMPVLPIALHMLSDCGESMQTKSMPCQQVWGQRIAGILWIELGVQKIKNV